MVGRCGLFVAGGWIVDFGIIGCDFANGCLWVRLLYVLLQQFSGCCFVVCDCCLGGVAWFDGG